jgi:branched-chain amino acid transport system ATP-binding protein
MLKVEKIACRYGRVAAIRDASLQVGAGELVALVGANGAGKTTLLRAISGLMKLAAGSITFDNERIDGQTAASIVRRGLAHCPEERKLWPALTVHENLMLGAYTRTNKAEIAADLDRVHTLFPRLAERDGQSAGTLSGGEQQMVAIGRALMSRPRLLMLDEPSLGLAPIMIESLVATIKDINRGGTAVLLVEQNAYLALGMADRAYVLEAGSIVREGSGSELMADPIVQASYLGRPRGRRAEVVSAGNAAV